MAGCDDPVNGSRTNATAAAFLMYFIAEALVCRTIIGRPAPASDSNRRRGTGTCSARRLPGKSAAKRSWIELGQFIQQVVEDLGVLLHVLDRDAAGRQHIEREREIAVLVDGSLGVAPPVVPGIDPIQVHLVAEPGDELNAAAALAIAAVEARSEERRVG